MKVKSINPGMVLPPSHDHPYTYDIIVNGEVIGVGDKYFASASAAKQDMREYVAWLRKHNGLLTI